MAWLGQISSQSEHDTQSSGRGIQGRGPLISRQSVGQMKTQSQQLVQRVSSSSGKRDSDTMTHQQPPSPL
jgi:hypothetical protein